MGIHGGMRLTGALTEFEQTLVVKRRSRSTVKAHCFPIRKLIEVVGDLPVRDLTEEHFGELLAHMGEDWAPSTRNMYMSNVRGKRGFLRYCRKRGWAPTDWDPLDDWENEKVAKRPRIWIDVDEFAALLDAASYPKDRAVIALGLFTLCRGSEITAMQWKHVNWQARTIDIYRQKTKQFDTIPMPSELLVELERWSVHVCQNQMVTRPDPDWYLIPHQYPLPMLRSGDRLQPTGEPPRLKPWLPMHQPYRSVKGAMERLGLDSFGGGVHVCRRSGGRARFFMYREDDGTSQAFLHVASLLGHADIKTTQVYLGIEPERLRRNELLAGKPMFGDKVLPHLTPRHGANVTPIRRTG